MSVAFSKTTVNKQLEANQWDEWRTISRNPESGLSRKERKRIHRDPRTQLCPIGAVAVRHIQGNSRPAAPPVFKSPLLVPNPNFPSLASQRRTGADSANWRREENSQRILPSRQLKDSGKSVSQSGSEAVGVNSQSWRREDSSEKKAEIIPASRFFKLFFGGDNASIWE